MNAINNKKLFLLASIMLIIGFLLLIRNSYIRNSNSVQNFNHSHDSLLSCLNNFEANNVLTGSLIPDIQFVSGFISKENLPVLVFRISELQCDMCIDQEIFRIKETVPHLRNKIVIIGSYNNYNKYYKWKHVSDKFISIPFDSIPWDIERQEKPYYFVINENLKISNIFIPDLRYKVMTTKYLSNIERLLSG